MDWSLMQPHAKHPFLRMDLGYKNPMVYYAAIILDPIMRFSWLFYVVFPGQRQHSAATSYFIGLGEIFRRFMWNFFRMENEHMTNVGQFIAARDVPLPFSIQKSPSGTPRADIPAVPQPVSRTGSIAARTMGSVRRGMVRMTSSIRITHAEDFARRSNTKEREPKGKLPDETDDTSGADAESEEEEREQDRRLAEQQEIEMRDIEEG